jgi:hypothetical protein
VHQVDEGAAIDLPGERVERPLRPVERCPMPERALLVFREVERDPQVLSDRNEPIDPDSVRHPRRVEQAHEAHDVADGLGGRHDNDRSPQRTPE